MKNLFKILFASACMMVFAGSMEAQSLDRQRMYGGGSQPKILKNKHHSGKEAYMVVSDNLGAIGYEDATNTGRSALINVNSLTNVKKTRQSYLGVRGAAYKWVMPSQAKYPVKIKNKNICKVNHSFLVGVVNPADKKCYYALFNGTGVDKSLTTNGYTILDHKSKPRSGGGRL